MYPSGTTIWSREDYNMMGYWTNSIMLTEWKDGTFAIYAMKEEGVRQFNCHSVQRIRRPERLLDAVLECADNLGYSWGWNDAAHMLTPHLTIEMAEAVNELVESSARSIADCPICHYPLELDKRCCRHFFCGLEACAYDERTGMRVHPHSDRRFVVLVRAAWSTYVSLADLVAERVATGRGLPRVQRVHGLSAGELANRRRVLKRFAALVTGGIPIPRTKLALLFAAEIFEGLIECPSIQDDDWIDCRAGARSRDESVEVIWVRNRSVTTQELRERLNFLDIAPLL